MRQPARIERFLALGIMLASAGALIQPPLRAQGPAAAALEQPDAPRIKQELANLLGHYPPALRGALALDPSLLQNESYLAPYPALASFLSAHPEIARNPSFYIEDSSNPVSPQDPRSQIVGIWRDVLNSLAIFAGFGLAFAVVIWLVRTIVDYRRWSRLARVQTDAHTKLLDRFTANEDLLAYIQSPAGSKFLESSPIKLDAGPRSVSAPVGRILWSIQGGLVLIAAGIGLQFVSGRMPYEVSQSLQVLGVLGIAVGLGFVVSAIISFVISKRLGLIELPPAGRRTEPSAAEDSATFK